MWPAWTLLRIPYDRLICTLYLALSPLLEHPRRTLSIESAAGGGSTIQRTVSVIWDPVQSFTLATVFSHVDLPLFTALAIGLPSLRRSRWGTLWRGVLALASLQVVRLAADLLVARGLAPDPLAPIRPGPVAFALSKAFVTTVFESDAIFVVPFLLWAVLQVPEFPRRAHSARPPEA